VPSIETEGFRAMVWQHYRQHRRDLPWRRTRDPYAILVSEIMLQQTQVARVIPKYEQFLAAFPTVMALSAAGSGEVLSLWQGLGYNRRALALHRAARHIVTQHGAIVPRTLVELRALPGIGPATAAAVLVFAFGLPVPFIETNIRSAFIHCFFREDTAVPDSAILPLVESTVDRHNPRDWYHALMDYGAWLKKHYPNPSRRSRHHTVHSPFAGSRRQLRAAVVRAVIGAAPVPMTAAGILASVQATGADPADLNMVLQDLAEEGFLARVGERYVLA
jgi:A/G-specific adenine glycosylase